MDIYSRKIITWEIHKAESGELAKKLVGRALLQEGYWHNPPVLHSDSNLVGGDIKFVDKLPKIQISF